MNGIRLLPIRHRADWHRLDKLVLATSAGNELVLDATSAMAFVAAAAAAVAPVGVVVDPPNP